MGVSGVRARVAVSVVALVACLGAVPARGAVTASQAGALGQQAYLYGIPLLESLRVQSTATSVRCPDTKGDAPFNAFSTATKFSDPSNRTVVAPNVDTLYSIAHLDLGRGPVVLGHPTMGHRYFVFQLLDPYTNTFAYVGSRTTGSGAGRFAITWTGKPGHRVAGARVITSHFRRVWVIGRTLASDAADQRRAVALMRRYTLTPPGGARSYRGCHPGHPRQAKTPTGLAFLDALGQALRDNPPPAADAPELAKLAAVGVGPGLRPETAGLPAGVLQALVASVSSFPPTLVTLAKNTILGQAKANHGWAIPHSDIGDYGTDYTYRAGVAELGLGANTPAEAIYPTGLTDVSGAELTGSRKYEMVFPAGQMPPVRAFWSLTLYDSAGYLVSNKIHRYAVGSSHPPLVRAGNGSIVVVISHTRPSGSGINWLPAPSGAFRLNLRLYWPKASALNGAWQPPSVVPLAGTS